jgi:hypothetical protein
MVTESFIMRKQPIALQRRKLFFEKVVFRANFACMWDTACAQVSQAAVKSDKLEP